jgi:hypothetical protein
MNKTFTFIIFTLAGLILLALVGCGGYGTIIKKYEVTEIPSIQFERIIKLYNPEGIPDKTLTGVVFIKKGAKVCTDYPREETIKSLDDLDMVEKQVYTRYSHYAIKVGDEIFGFFSIAQDYRANIWENIKDEDCKYKVQIIIPERVKGTGDSGLDPGVGTGGHGGGVVF